MQNRSYDRYVELLRAAELQSYERTSARFIATTGAVATGSWIARNPLLASLAALVSVVMIALTVTCLQPDAQTVSTQRSQSRSIDQAQAAPTPTPHSSHVTADAAPLAEAVQSSSSQDDGSMLATESVGPVEVKRNAGVMELNTEEVEGTIHAADVRPASVPMEIGSEKGSPTRLIIAEFMTDHRAPHRWLFSVGMNSLPSIDPGYQFNIRTTAMLEADNGFAFGIGAGVRNIRENTREFAGYIDTVFVIGGQQLPSKIGQYRTTESSLTHLEVGVAASYQFQHIFGGPEVAPSIAIFAGLEGKAVVLEQSLNLNWRATDRLTFFAGLSLREYPWAMSNTRLSPLLGVTVGF